MRVRWSDDGHLNDKDDVARTRRCASADAPTPAALTEAHLQGKSVSPDSPGCAVLEEVGHGRSARPGATLLTGSDLKLPCTMAVAGVPATGADVKPSTKLGEDAATGLAASAVLPALALAQRGRTLVLPEPLDYVCHHVALRTGAMACIYFGREEPLPKQLQIAHERAQAAAARSPPTTSLAPHAVSEWSLCSCQRLVHLGAPGCGPTPLAIPECRLSACIAAAWLPLLGMTITPLPLACPG